MMEVPAGPAVYWVPLAVGLPLLAAAATPGQPARTLAFLAAWLLHVPLYWELCSPSWQGSVRRTQPLLASCVQACRLPIARHPTPEPPLPCPPTPNAKGHITVSAPTPIPMQRLCAASIPRDWVNAFA